MDAIGSSRLAEKLLTLLAALALLGPVASSLSCRAPESDGDGDGDPYGTNPFVEGIEGSVGEPTVDRLLEAARRCGYQGWGTIPVGWEMTLTGEQGCAVWAPPDWVASGAGTTVTVVEQGPGVGAGFISLGGTPDVGTPIECTPAGAAQYLTDSFAAAGCSSPTTLYFDEYVENIAGIDIPTADYLFTCAMNGVTRLDYLWVTIQGTSPLCNILSLGFWVPVDAIEAMTCTATQVLQSLRCPQPGGGFCEAQSCNDDCVQSGHEGGSCGADDTCHCF